MSASAWFTLHCCRQQLQLDRVLVCGQSFRWKGNAGGEWLGVIANKVWRLKQDDSTIYYQVYEASSDPEKLTLESQQTRYGKQEKEDKLAFLSLNVESQQTRYGKQEKDKLGLNVESQQTRYGSKEEVRMLQTKEKNQSAEHDRLTNPNICKWHSLEREKFLPEKSSCLDSIYRDILHDYFQLDVDIESLYHQWSDTDAHFRTIAVDFSGIRMLRLDPIESLFSFICSSNNHIARISSLVEKLCDTYGQPIAVVDGKQWNTFPSVACLAREGVECKLQELGFGYRAKFIAASAKYIVQNGGEDWILSLRQLPYPQARMQLMKLHGVGAKVGDCVCLTSLNKHQAIPVDTHVWQVAARHYLPKLHSAKSLTDKLYQEIGDHFRKIWGQYAGWAQAVLFSAELKHLQVQNKLTDRTVEHSDCKKRKLKASQTNLNKKRKPE